MTKTLLPDFSKVEWQAPSLGAEVAAFRSKRPRGIALKPAYGPSDVAGLDFLNTYPGLPPFLRGPYPTMYVHQPWTVRQYAGFSTAEDSNAFYRRNLAAGQKGLSVAFDLATHRGYDSDHRASPATSAWPGSPSTPSTTCAPVRWHPARRDERVHDHERRRAAGAGALHRRRRRAGSAARAALRHDPERHPERVHGAEHLHLSARSPRCASSPTSSPTRAPEMPKFNSISISGYHMQEAGATADLELAYTLADGVEYVRAGIAAGLDVDAFAPRLSFFWAIGMNYFMEVAKNAGRARCSGRGSSKDFGPKTPKSMSLRAHCQTSGWSLTAQDVFNNVMRTCVEALAATQGRHAEPAHQCARRSAGPADGFFRAYRPQHPAFHRIRDGHHTRHRPLGRQLLCRAPDQRACRKRLGRTSRKSRSSAAWQKP